MPTATATEATHLEPIQKAIAAEDERLRRLTELNQQRKDFVTKLMDIDSQIAGVVVPQNGETAAEADVPRQIPKKENDKRRRQAKAHGGARKRPRNTKTLKEVVLLTLLNAHRAKTKMPLGLVVKSVDKAGYRSSTGGNFSNLVYQAMLKLRSATRNTGPLVSKDDQKGYALTPEGVRFAEAIEKGSQAKATA